MPTNSTESLDQDAGLTLPVFGLREPVRVLAADELLVMVGAKFMGLNIPATYHQE